MSNQAIERYYSAVLAGKRLNAPSIEEAAADLRQLYVMYPAAA